MAASSRLARTTRKPGWNNILLVLGGGEASLTAIFHYTLSNSDTSVSNLMSQFHSFATVLNYCTVLWGDFRLGWKKRPSTQFHLSFTVLETCPQPLTGMKVICSLSLSLSHVKFHTMSSFFLMWHLINYKPKSHCLNISRSHLTKDMWYPPSRGLDLTLLFNLQSRAGACTVRKSCDC
jgi:hypothetical protein